MQSLIEQILVDQESHGEVGHGPATDEQITHASQQLGARFGAALPKDYARFLRRSNGLDYNGVLLYSAMDSGDEPGVGDFWYGLVAANATWREVSGHEGHLVLGEADMDLLTVAVDGTGPVLRDKVSSDVNERFDSVAQAIESILQRRL